MNIIRNNKEERLQITKILTGLFSDKLSLESILDELAKYGHPRLNKSKNGWSCIIDIALRSGIDGVEIEIKSDWGHDTSKAAAKQCLERLSKAIQDLVDGIIEGS